MYVCVFEWSIGKCLICMYSTTKWHLKHVSRSIALAGPKVESHSKTTYERMLYIYIHFNVCIFVLHVLWDLWGLGTLGFLAWLPFWLPRQLNSSWGNTWNVFVDKHDHESFFVPLQMVDISCSPNAFVSLDLHMYTCIHIYICSYLYLWVRFAITPWHLLYCFYPLCFCFLLRFLWFVCDFHASFRLVCVRSLLSFTSPIHSHTYTHALLRTRRYLTLTLSLSLSHCCSPTLPLVAWCELSALVFWLRFGICSAYSLLCSTHICYSWSGCSLCIRYRYSALLLPLLL